MGFVFGQPLSAWVATFSALVAFIFQAVSLASTGWIEKTIANAWKITEGLWEVCNETLDTGENKWCEDMPDELVEEWLESTRAFGVVSVVLLVLCLLLIVLIFVCSQRPIFSILAPIMSGLACFFIMMEFSFYADNVRKSNTQEHEYGFYLCIVAWILSFVATVLLADARKRIASVYTEVKSG